MSNVNVVVKIRPRSEKEINGNIKEQWTVTGESMHCNGTSFDFDHIYGPTSTNADVFFAVIAPMVESCKNGINATVFTYGQKGSGKTHTMIGKEEDPGIQTLAIRQLFQGNELATNRQFIVRVGYIEILNELVYDLLNRRQKVHVNGDTMSNKEVIVKDETTILKILQRGTNAKTPRTSIDNQRLSSSHTIFQIIIESADLTLESGVQVSRFNFVDMDRSEGARVKDENGNCVDKSCHCLCLAITALSKGEKFNSYSRSKLTRILKTSLLGNADTAIICNITPTAVNQTTCSLNFATDAKKVKTKAMCNKVHTDQSVIRQVRDKIARLEDLKTELDALLMTGSCKINDQIAEMESIFTDMKPKEQSFMQQEPIRVLKIRPFFDGCDKKYQIGEMDGKCIDAQSREQRKSTAFKWSDFYLERVGFEINVNMRRHLKFGNNLIGRSDVDADICIDSLECSRKHCFITVSDKAAVSLTDLKSSNGTVINGVKFKGQTVELHEGDVISIVGGKNLSILVGNYEFTVYRLCKLNSDKIQTFNLNDDEVIELSEDDETDGTLYGPVCVKMEQETPQPSLFLDVETSTEIPPLAAVQDQSLDNNTLSNDGDVIEISDDGNNVTSYAPVTMELELPQVDDKNSAEVKPLESVLADGQDKSLHNDVMWNCRPSNDADVIEISDDGNNVTSYAPVAMELEPSQVDDKNSTEMTPLESVRIDGQDQSLHNGSHGSSSDQKCDSGYDFEFDFDLTNYVLGTFEDLDEINVTPLPQVKNPTPSISENLVPKRNIQNENDELKQQLAKLTSDYENNKKLLTEQIGITQKELEALQAQHNSLNQLKLAGEQRKDHIIQLQSQLIELTQMETTLQNDNAKMAEKNLKQFKKIEFLNAKLEALQDDSYSLQQQNLNYVKELMDHFKKSESYNKKHKYN